MYGDIDENWLLDLGIERINWQVWQVWQVSSVRGNVKSRSLNITITNYSDRNGRNIQLFSESVWSVWLIPQRLVSFVLRNEIIWDDKKKALLKFDKNHMCRLWSCKGFSSFIDYLWELSVAVKNSHRCNFGQLLSQIVRQTVTNSSDSQLVLMSVGQSVSQSVKWIKGVRRREKSERACPLSPTVTTIVTNSHHHPVTTTTSS